MIALARYAATAENALLKRPLSSQKLQALVFIHETKHLVGQNNRARQLSQIKLRPKGRAAH